jgi:hypothetical protein
LRSNLFSARIFNNVLTKERYDHFRCLAFVAHLIEASRHDQSTYLEVLDLLQEFDIQFEALYKVHLSFLTFFVRIILHKTSHHLVLIKKSNSDLSYRSRNNKQNQWFMHLVTLQTVFESMVLVTTNPPSNSNRLLVSVIKYSVKKLDEGIENEDQILRKNSLENAYFMFLAFRAHVTEIFSQKQHFDIYALISHIFIFHIAALTRTIHNGNKPTTELLKNIDLLQQTWLATTDSSFPPEMKLFDHQIHSNMRYSIPTHISDLHRHHTRVHKKMSITCLAMDVSNFILKSTRDRSYLLYKTILVDGQRYSADSINIHRPTHDGCILYDKNNVSAIGFLETVIHFIDNNEFSLVIRPVILYSTADTLSMNDRIYQCTNVLYGTSDGSSIEDLHYRFVIQKLAFRYGTDLNFPPLVKSMFFFQFPNLRAST